LQKEKHYESEEKKKEQFFLRKQKNEAFLAETVAKRAARKYNILTFPDKNMKRLTDFVEKTFPLPSADKSHGHPTKSHRVVRQPAAENLEAVSHSHLAQADSERIHALASQKKHGLTKLAPVPEDSSSYADAGNGPQHMLQFSFRSQQPIFQSAPHHRLCPMKLLTPPSFH
jgi:hypothetical protein